MMSESVTVNVQDGSGRPAAGGGGAAPAAAGGGGAGAAAGNKSNNAQGNNPLANLRMNQEYFLKSIPGYIKIAQLLVGIICMACGWHGFFQFVAISAFILTLIWCILYLFQLREALSKLPVNWILTELINTGVYAALYFVAFIIQLIYAGSHAAYIAAGVFGLINTLLYSAGTYFLYLEHKNGQAQ